MSTTTTTTKRTTPGKAEAKAKAKAEASVRDAAAALTEEADAVTRFHLLAVGTASTKSAHLAAANEAAGYVKATEADAFRGIAAARQAIGARLFAAYRDGNEEAKEAADVTFTSVMAAATGCDEAAWTARGEKREIKRGWSTLKEDFAVFVHTTGDAWMDAYVIAVGDGTPTVRDYLAFTKRAEAEATAAEERGESSQAKSARTAKAKREAAEAEATRQAEAAAKAKRDRETAAEEAKAEAERVALDLCNAVTLRPSANVVPGVEITNATVAALSVDTLRAAAAVFTAWADHVDALAAAKAKADKAAGKAAPKVAGIVAEGQAKAEAIVASHNTEEEAEALGQAAEANEADEMAEYRDYLAFKAMRAKATA